MSAARTTGPMIDEPFGHLGPGVRAVVTNRYGGVSTGPYASLNLAHHVGDDDAAVNGNRALVCEHLGIEALTVAEQVHGDRVAVIDEALAGAGHVSLEDSTARLGGVDGLITDIPGVALTVLVADCQPIVLWDSERRALGVAHAGRLGTVLGVVPAVVDELGRTYGTDPADLRVGIGPHIGPQSYEVGPAEAEEFASLFGPDLVHPTAGGRASLDLEGAVRQQLAFAGVPAEAVVSTGVDTLVSDAHFSHRRTRPCGRVALIAVIDDRS